MNQLEALRRWSTVVADTGDFHQLAQFQPRDATTNPTLILKAAQLPAYRPLIDDVMDRHKDSPLDELTDHLLVHFGTAILSLIPGRVSTEVDARLSFDTAATVARAERIVEAYKKAGVDTDKRLLIKIAATWEGIQAAAALEKRGIRCNLTLVFSLCQAISCADAGVTLISPFVGRIYDWHKRAAGARWDEATYGPANDPGVQSVRDIFDYYKRHGIATEIMGASFRNVGQITALAGCDLLTISPLLLNELSKREGAVPLMLDAQAAKKTDVPALHFEETGFRYALNADAMASESLAEGIRGFAADAAKLEAILDAHADPDRLKRHRVHTTYYYARICRDSAVDALERDPATSSEWQRSDSDLLGKLMPLVEAGNQVFGKGSHWIELRHSTDPDFK